MGCENKVSLTGNLGRDAELKYTANGQAIASFSVATTTKWKTEGGEKKERTDWHRCSMFGKRAEALSRYLTKGTTIQVEGSIQYREYEKDGVKKYSTDIVVNDVLLLGGGSKDSSDRGNSKPAARSGPADDDGFVNDDIPF